MQKVQELKTFNGSPIVLNTDIVSSDPIDMPPKKSIAVSNISRNFKEVETGNVCYYSVDFDEDVNLDTNKISSSSFNTTKDKILRSIYNTNTDPSSQIEVVELNQDLNNRKCFTVGVRTKGTKGNIQLGIRDSLDFFDSNKSFCRIENNNNLVERDTASIIRSLVYDTVQLLTKSKEALVGQDVQYVLEFPNHGIKLNSLKSDMFVNKNGPTARISNIQPNGKNSFTLNATLDQPGSLQLVLKNKSELETVKGTKIGFENDIKANQNVEYKSESFKGKVILIIVDTKFLRTNPDYFQVIATLANQPGPCHPDKPQILSKEGLKTWDGKVPAVGVPFDSVNDNDFTEAWNLAQKEFENRNNNNPIKPFLIWADDSNIKKFVPNKNDDASPDGKKSNILLHLFVLGRAQDLDVGIIKQLGNGRWSDFKIDTDAFVESLLLQLKYKANN